MQSSPLRNKSEILTEAAKLLHDKSYYCAVAHAAYYSCYQMLKYIWLYPMGKTQNELNVETSVSRMGVHEYLLNAVAHHINGSNKNDARNLRNRLPQLKKFRIDADYFDITFDSFKSKRSMQLSEELMSILKKY